MTEFVRVKDTVTGHEYSAPKRWAEASKGVEVLADKTAANSDGRPLPPKPKVNLTKAENKAPAEPAYAAPRQNGDESR